jgi:hypothetical protein
MKKQILLSLFFLPALAFAQFPAPDSFRVDVQYIVMDSWDLCNGQYLAGPAYCNHFLWQAPDTANTPATLAGYRLYKDDEFFLATANTAADTAGGYMHVTFYVTAVYENPAGESAPSNSVYIGDLPVGTDEPSENHQVRIGVDLSQQVLIIRGTEYTRALWVYDMYGRAVLFTDAVRAVQRLDGLGTGVYWVVVQDRYGRVSTKVFCLAK